MKNIDTKAFFLPYQVRWLEDKSRIKLAEKSRRIGFTYVQSYEDVYDALTLKINGKPCDVFFSSADRTAATEYINYCAYWAKLFNAAFEDFGEIILDERKDIKAFAIQFKNGARIIALSSNPTQFRSKGGKVVLDEFAFHEDPLALWKAAKPCITWGYPLRIISTHNGQNCLFYQFIKQIDAGKLNWSHHKITIQKAVDEGFVDKIYGRKTTKKEREQWLIQEKADCGDEQTWLQEYCCVAVDESTAFLTYEMLQNIKEKDILKPYEELSGDLYLGFDVARKKDLSVISVLEKVSNTKFLRHQVVMKKLKFREQKAILYGFLSMPNLRRACIDSTGIGAQIAEDARIDFGKSKVEEVTFTNAVKEEISYQLYTAVEDKNLIIDVNTDENAIEDYHSVRKFTTKSGNIRFDSDGSSDGHADRFFSLALANHAASGKSDFQKPEILTAKPNKIKGFDNISNLRGFTDDLRGVAF